MDVLPARRALHHRWLTPAVLLVGAVMCLLYWENVSRSLEFVETEIDRRGMESARLLARTAAAGQEARGGPGQREALRWLRETEPDAPSGALFATTGRMLMTNDPFYFQDFPSNILKLSGPGRAVVHDGFDACISPMADRRGRPLGYAVVKVSRDRLRRLALDALRRTLVSALGVAAVLLLALHLLMRRVAVFAAELDRRVQARTLALSQANGALADEVRRRQAAQDALARARDEALRVAKVKTEFLAKMSHEIRTPISGIIGMTDLLMSTGLAEEQYEYASTARRCAESLMGVINDVLDFSKIEAGKLELDAVDFAPGPVVEEVCEMMAVSARRKGLEIACLLSPRLPAAVAGDPQRLRQVLMNLIGNAVKFTDDGEVVVDCAPGAAAGSIVFSVSDTGIGVRPESRDRIFDDYAQADGTDARRYGGSGLGLSISRSLVEKMGGAIRFEPRAGGGSAFVAEVRLAAPKSPAPPPPALPAPAPRALVVETHEPSRRAAEQALRALGAEVESFEGAGASLRGLVDRLSGGERFALALIDARLSGPDGAPLARLLRTAPASASARIVASAYVADLLSIRDRLGTCDAWVRKPLRRAELAAAVAGSREARAAAAKPAAAAPAAEFSGRRVLLAEDNAVNARIALAQLSALGVQGVWVEDGAKALERLAEGKFDLVLMDCQMPGLDGYAAATRWRQSEGAAGRLPIVAVTAHAMAEERARCLAAGMDDHLAKPVTKAGLTDCLRRWLDDWDEAAFREAAHADPLDAAGAELLSGFLKDAPGRLDAIRRSAASGDEGALREAARALRGEAGFVGARRLQSLCGVLEETPAGGPRGGLLAAMESSFEAARQRIADSRWRQRPRAGA